jgi:glutaredoxin
MPTKPIHENSRQHCNLWKVWASWVVLAGIVAYIAMVTGPLLAAVLAATALVAQVVYVRMFPAISKWLGYGSVEDVAASSPPGSSTPRRVVFYAARACPFCPIVRRRLRDLAADMRLEVEEVDVTFRPDIVRRKGFRAVPVLESDGRFWVGNATTAELAAFLGT